MAIFSSVIQGLAGALELYHARHRVLAENVANSETPGYRARNLEFDDVLRAVFQGGSKDQEGSASEPILDRGAVVKIDGNSVDMDTEMARLSDNALTIVALSRMLARKYEGLKNAIAEGRR